MITCQKHHFSLPEDVHYLNCAYKGPIPKISEQTGVNAVRRDRDPSTMSAQDFFTTQEEVRKLFAKRIGASPDDIAIHPSTSYGFASVLQNVASSAGREIILVQDEFPSEYYTADRWCKDHDAELVIIETPAQQADWTDAILSRINSNTATVLLSAIHWMNGATYDLKAIGQRCQEVDAYYIIDGTQYVGAVDLDVHDLHIDALICASYKWLFGPYGMALGYYGPRFHDGRPLEETWMNRSNAENFSSLTNYSDRYTPAAGRYNVGQTSHFILMPMLLASLQCLEAWKPSDIQRYDGMLKQRLYDNLGLDPDQSYHHLFGIKLPRDCDAEKFQSLRQERKIALSVRGEYLRISLHLFNDTADIDALLQTIYDAKG